MIDLSRLFSGAGPEDLARTRDEVRSLQTALGLLAAAIDARLGEGGVQAPAPAPAPAPSANGHANGRAARSPARKPAGGRKAKADGEVRRKKGELREKLLGVVADGPVRLPDVAEAVGASTHAVRICVARNSACLMLDDQDRVVAVEDDEGVS